MRRLITLAIAGILAGCSGSDPSSPPAPSGTGPQGEMPEPGTPSTDEALAPSDVTRSAGQSLVAHAVAPVDPNLTALRELRIFEVEGVIEEIPEGANCSGNPCPGHEGEFAEAKRSAALRLADFTSKALLAAAHPVSDAYAPQTGPVAEGNLTSLKSLQIVALGGLILEQPKNNAKCFDLPCDEDRRAADEINRDRACRLASIAAAFRPAP
jgi:hypothetical protein